MLCWACGKLNNLQQFDLNSLVKNGIMQDIHDNACLPGHHRIIGKYFFKKIKDTISSITNPLQDWLLQRMFGGKAKGRWRSQFSDTPFSSFWYPVSF